MQKRAKTSWPGRIDAQGVFDDGEALMGEVLVWPVAADYRITPGGLIVPEPGCREHPTRRWPPPSPLADPELYSSFGKLGRGARRGKRARDRVRGWVQEHGLLRRQRSDLGGHVLLEGRLVNQAPMAVEDFIAEAERFGSLLKLYAEIKSADVEAIASRVGRRATVLDEHLASAVSEAWSIPKNLHTSLGWVVSYAKHPLLWIAGRFLEGKTAEGLAGVGIRPVSGFDLPWETTDEELRRIRAAPARPYLPAVSFTCPDLLSAIYLQLMLVMSRRAPVRRCKACGLPLPENAPKHRHYCNSTCRSNARNHRASPA